MIDRRVPIRVSQSIRWLRKRLHFESQTAYPLARQIAEKRQTGSAEIPVRNSLVSNSRFERASAHHTTPGWKFATVPKAKENSNVTCRSSAGHVGPIFFQRCLMTRTSRA